jgi:hypothetical protein
MDRKQLIIQRAHEFFAGRFDAVADMARRQQEMIGLEQPASAKPLMQRIVRDEAMGMTASASAALMEAQDVEPGQAGGLTPQLLEFGAASLEKIAAHPAPDLTDEEFLGLEYLLIHHGRPAFLIRQGRLGQVSPFWNSLEAHREGIEMAQRGVGRIELVGHPEYDWAGTAFLVTDTCLLTTRRTAEIFAENDGKGHWQFRPGISAWIDYRSQYRPGTMACYRVRQVLGAHDKYDLALLEVDPPAQTIHAPCPLPLASQAPDRLEDRPVYVIGYPIREPRRNEPEFIARAFGDVYNVKRIQPGELRGCKLVGDVYHLQHDAAMLGHSQGACVIDLETHQVLGMHLFGRYLEAGNAAPLWMLADDPLLKRCGIRFADEPAQDLEATAHKLECLARSRHWADARAAINNLYQRAFGEYDDE